MATHMHIESHRIDDITAKWINQRLLNRSLSGSGKARERRRKNTHTYIDIRLWTSREWCWGFNASRVCVCVSVISMEWTSLETDISARWVSTLVDDGQWEKKKERWLFNVFCFSNLPNALLDAQTYKVCIEHHRHPHVLLQNQLCISQVSHDQLKRKRGREYIKMSEWKFACCCINVWRWSDDDASNWVSHTK